MIHGVLSGGEDHEGGELGTEEKKRTFWVFPCRQKANKRASGVGASRPDRGVREDENQGEKKIEERGEEKSVRTLPFRTILKSGGPKGS